jgi:CubicO group peptidase (beta-lactamase class C family)
MVKKVYVIFMVAACSLQTMAQTTDQIKKVENGLIPYVPVKGFPSWNIYQRMKYYHVKGVSIAVIKDYKLAWAKGYGLADTARNMSVTTKTMFSAGSISKFLAAAVAMCLVEQNKLQLDSPVNHYLRSWKIGENDFTRKKTRYPADAFKSYSRYFSDFLFWVHTGQKAIAENCRNTQRPTHCGKPAGRR